MNRDDLKKYELSDEQVTEILNAVHAEYDPFKTQAETEKQRADKLQSDYTAMSDKVKTLESTSGDAEKYKEELAKVKETITQKETEHAEEIKKIREESDNKEFDLLLDNVLTESGAKNAKAAKALLDIDTLKTSKNRREDIATAVKALSEDENSSFLFGEREPGPTGEKKDFPGGTGGKGGGEEHHEIPKVF